MHIAVHITYYLPKINTMRDFNYM